MSINPFASPAELEAIAAARRHARRADLAKAAMVAVLGNQTLLLRVDAEAPNDPTRVALARYAYAIADAMLEAEGKA